MQETSRSRCDAIPTGGDRLLGSGCIILGAVTVKRQPAWL